ncbi:hypothetical protein [Hymenobacter lapidiphilus]|uniref:Uncharacterized protein n=1 Tax=Hymenobacter lapidiphilus TaxID=2608003 RepID=A0A7Y7PT01_9BACT|nr:hypothetical protein [Hymenobacter lapidiphilus]NVO33489.1 hypothetical protein [Hymenobacter lapidiphilus]
MLARRLHAHATGQRQRRAAFAAWLWAVTADERGQRRALPQGRALLAGPVGIHERVRHLN